jgi:spore coat protein U-like protein
MSKPSITPRLLAVAAFVVGIGAPLAIAATQGNVGSTSTGTVDVKADKQPAVRISGLNDIQFAASAVTPAPQSDPVCVFSNPGQYLVRASGANANGATFRLKDGGANYIAYGVRWHNAATGGSSVDLSSGVTSAGVSGADQASVSCGGNNTARIEIILDDTTYIAAPAGSYSDTLTLLVSPP